MKQLSYPGSEGDGVNTEFRAKTRENRTYFARIQAIPRGSRTAVWISVFRVNPMESTQVILHSTEYRIPTGSGWGRNGEILQEMEDLGYKPLHPLPAALGELIDSCPQGAQLQSFTFPVQRTGGAYYDRGGSPQ